MVFNKVSSWFLIGFILGWVGFVLGAEFRILAQDERRISIELTFADPIIEKVSTDRGIFLKVTQSGFSYTGEQGQPCLPFKGFVLKVPLGPIQVEATALETKEVHLGDPLIPAQADVQVAETPQRVLSKPTKMNVAKTNPYPPILARAEGMGLFRGHQLAALKVFPYQYLPGTQSLRITRKMLITLSFSKEKSGGRIGSLRRMYPAEKNLLKGLVANATGMDIYGRFSSTPGGGLLQRIEDQTTGEYKIVVDEVGLYHLTYEWLTAAGVSLEGVDPRTLKLVNKGWEVPIYVYGEGDNSFDPGDYVDFWGEPNWKTLQDQADDFFYDPYSDENIYWLSWGGSPGLRLVEESGAVVESDPLRYVQPNFYPFTVHQEQDNYYDRLSQVEADSLPRDHWFFDSGLSAGQQRDYTINLPHPDPLAIQRAQVRVMLHGKTYNNDPPPQIHRVFILVNNHNIPSLECSSEDGWSDQTKRLVQTIFDEEGIFNSQLIDGTNTLTVFNPGPGIGENDAIFLNWFEIAYQRSYRAQDNFIQFTRQQDLPQDTLYDFTIEGFSRPDIEIYKLGVSKIVSFESYYWEDEPGEGYYVVHFQDRIPVEEEYIALTPDKKKIPKAIIRDVPSDLTAPDDGGADYIIIADSSFVENERWQEFITIRERDEEISRVKLINVQDIYDEFNYGIKSPYAIKNFLRFAFENWDKPPFYVLLVGDGSWDQKDRRGDGGNLLPVYYTQCEKWGATASDFWYTLISGEDLIPDLAIGRFPVRTNLELDNILDKIFEYEEQTEFDEWRNKCLFITGIPSSQTDFVTKTEEMIRDCVSPYYDVLRLRTGNPSDPFYGGTTRLKTYFEDGAVIVNFSGHGGGAIWSDNSLFRIQDVARLHNQGRYPFIMNPTPCFITAFDTPTAHGTLGEEFLMAPNKGAIAVWGATGLGWFLHGTYIGEELIRALLDGTHPTLGEAINRAKINYWASYSYAPQAFANVHQMTLLGDPGLRLNLPQQRGEITLSPNLVDTSEIIIVSGAGFSRGQEGMVKIYNGYHKPLNQYGEPSDEPKTYPFQVSPAGSFQLTSLQIPPGLTTESGTIRAYAFNQNGEDTHAYANFYVARAYGDTIRFDSLGTVPPSITEDDSIYFKVQVISSDGVDSVFTCVIIGDDADTLAMRGVGGNSFYHTVNPVGPYPRGTDIEYWFLTKDIGGQLTSSTHRSVTVPYNPDLAITPEDIQLAGQDSVELVIRFRNQGDARVDLVEVAVYEGDPDSGGDSLWTGWMSSLEPDSSARVQFAPNFMDGKHLIFVLLDPDSLVEESNEDNNRASTQILVNQFNVSERQGTHFPGSTQNDTVNVDSIIFVKIPPNAIFEEKKVLRIDLMENLLIEGQPGLTFWNENPRGYQVLFADGKNMLEKDSSAAIQFRFDQQGSEDLSNLGVYRRHENNRQWVRVESFDTDSGFVTFDTPQLGLFTLLESADRKAPVIEISVEGQDFWEGGYVPSHPKISAVIQDENGIDIRLGKIIITVDGDTLPEDQIALPDSLFRSNSVSVSINPTFPPGPHTVKFVAHDNNGNEGLASIGFVVSDVFDIEFIGNYPNPFSEETIFAYQLKQPAEEVTIKIYTVSGRLIRTLIDPGHLETGGVISYSEISWDATDEYGDTIANGVYFYKLEARQGEKAVTRIMKMAKVPRRL